MYDRQLAEARAWLDAQANFDVLYVDFHDVLHDTGSVVDALDTFLGGGLHSDLMLRVPDAELYRVRG